MALGLLHQSPLAAVIIGLTLWRVPESRNEHAGRAFDWLGASLATAGLGAITYAVIEAPIGGVSLWVGVAGLAALGCFVIVERTASRPMVSLHLFKSRDFTGANLLTFLLYATLSGILFFLPLNLIQVQHYSAVRAGAALLPLILRIFALSRWSGGLVARNGVRPPLTVGPLIAACGFALFLRPGIGGSCWTTFFPAVVVLGIGLAISVAPLTTAVMESVCSSEAGVASGINNAVSRAAGLLAVALFGLILSAGFNRALDHSLSRLAVSPAQRENVARRRAKLAGAQINELSLRNAVEAFVSGFYEVIWISIAMGFLSALSAQMIQSNRPAKPTCH